MMAGTPTGTGSNIRIEFVAGALQECRNSGASMALVNQLGSQYLAKANAQTGGGCKLAYHMVARKYIANVYTATSNAMLKNAVNQSLAKLL